MSAAEAQKSLLSQEELDALLAELGQAADELVAGLHAGVPPRLLPMARSVVDFASEQSRAMSTLYQRSIEFRMLDLQEVPTREFVDFLLPVDRVIVLQFEPGPWVGYLLIGRSLLFAWQALAFGAQADTPLYPVPERPYTRIEERFLRRVATELASQLAQGLRSRGVHEVKVMELVEPDAIRSSDEAVHMASVDVSGLGDLCRLRIALPGALQPDELRESLPETAPPTPPRLRSAVLEMPVSVRVEAGHVEIPLGRVASLKPGDVLEILPGDPRGHVVNVEDEARFVAVSGSVGGKLAVQLTETA